jgi:hypothetical protein
MLIMSKIVRQMITAAMEVVAIYFLFFLSACSISDSSCTDEIPGITIDVDIVFYKLYSKVNKLRKRAKRIIFA